VSILLCARLDDHDSVIIICITGNLVILQSVDDGSRNLQRYYYTVAIRPCYNPENGLADGSRRCFSTDETWLCASGKGDLAHAFVATVVVDVVLHVEDRVRLLIFGDTSGTCECHTLDVSAESSSSKHKQGGNIRESDSRLIWGY
jgi:hypothetical protein